MLVFTRIINIFEISELNFVKIISAFCLITVIVGNYKLVLYKIITNTFFNFMCFNLLSSKKKKKSLENLSQVISIQLYTL